MDKPLPTIQKKLNLSPEVVEFIERYAADVRMSQSALVDSIIRLFALRQKKEEG